jgi:hypothetical protein
MLERFGNNSLRLTDPSFGDDEFEASLPLTTFDRSQLVF